MRLEVNVNAGATRYLVSPFYRFAPPRFPESLCQKLIVLPKEINETKMVYFAGIVNTFLILKGCMSVDMKAKINVKFVNFIKKKKVINFEVKQGKFLEFQFFVSGAF